MKEREIFIEALQRPESERSALLESACGDDERLRQHVESLLAQHEKQGQFLLDAPPPGLEPGLSPGAPVAEVGDTIGRYVLLERIGEGGFGDVFRAEQLHPVMRVVAIKAIKVGMDTRQVVARFEAERQAMALMDHPHIAKVFDAGATDSGRPYFVTELVDGMPLTEYCDSHQLSTTERLKLFLDVCRGVQHAHQKGVIHRDIKPSNLLVAEVDGQPVPKIIDFGVAKATRQRLTEKTLFTELGQLIGTPEYMSPEQATFQDADVDTRSDVYSLGVILYELLVGTTPFSDSKFESLGYDEICQIIRQVDAVTPSRRLSSMRDQAESVCQIRQCQPVVLRRILKGDLDWIVMKSLEKERGRRYDSVDALMSDIQRYLSGRPVDARPPGTWYKLRKLVSRFRALFIAATALVLMLTLTAMISTTLYLRAEYQRKRAEESLASVKRLIMQTLIPAVEETRFRPRSQTLSRKLVDDTIEEFSVLADQSNRDELQLDLAKLYLARAKNEFYIGNNMREDCDAAIQLLTQLASEKPSDPDVRSTLASSYRMLGHHLCQELQYSAAVVAYERQREVIGPRHNENPWLAFALRKTGRLAEAHALAIRDVRLPNTSPGTYLVWENHGINLLELGQPNAAKKVFEEALRYFDSLVASGESGMRVEFNRASYQAFVGRACNAMQEFAEGERHLRDSVATFEKLKRERPKFVWLPRFLGAAYVSLSDSLVGMGKSHWSEAEKALRSAIENFRVFGQPRDLAFEASAHFRLGQLLTFQDRLSNAKLSLVAARERGEEIVLRVPREDRCKRELIVTLTVSPLSELRDTERALELARRIQPREDPMLWQLIALAEYRAGNWDEAINASEQAISRLRGAKTLGQLVIAMAKRRQAWDSEGQESFDEACQSIDDVEPILFSTFLGPLTVHQLRTEAEQLLAASP